VQPLEGSEEFLHVSHVKAGAVIPHEIHRLAVGCSFIRPLKAEVR
jgi:hypothetical protein